MDDDNPFVSESAAQGPSPAQINFYDGGDYEDEYIVPAPGRFAAPTAGSSATPPPYAEDPDFPDDVELGSNPLPPASPDGARVKVLEDEEPEDFSQYQVWQLEFYRYFCNVETHHVLLRMARSFTPYPPRFMDQFSGRPDLYGSFWLPTLLIFLLAFTGNISLYLNAVLSASAKDDGREGKESFTTFFAVPVLVILVYLYCALLPTGLWASCKYWLHSEHSFLSFAALTSYAMTPYCALTLLCLLPSGWYVSAGAMPIAGLLSTVFLLANLWHEAKRNWKIGVWVMVAVVVLQFCFVVSLVLYYALWINWDPLGVEKSVSDK